VAAVDQAINTNYFKNTILKEETDSKYWLCKRHKETTNHLNSGCPLWQNTYLMRHNKVRAIYSTCKALRIEMTSGTHTHTPKPLCEHKDVTLLRNQGVHTDREVTADNN